MATKLKRTLFIGLGGTGVQAVLEAKRLFAEQFGQIPPIIGFLGVDTNLGEFSKSTSKVYLDQNERIQLVVNNPEAFYMEHKEVFDWLSPKNLRSLQTLKPDGAGQIRTNGRFAFTIKHDEVRTAVSNAIRRISGHISNMTNDKWELDGDSSVQIHLVFSISGGTGCGTFINMAALLRDVAPNCNLVGYALMPDVFINCGDYVGTNAYGALRDLDFLMSKVDVANPFKLRMLDNSELTLSKIPFDQIFMVDASNDHGDCVSDIDDMVKLVGRALSTVSGPLGVAVAGNMSNFRTLIADGNCVNQDKTGWASGMGFCEILFNAQRLKDIYANKAAYQLAKQLIGAQPSDTIGDVLSWFNENGLQEDNADQLLDSLYEMNRVRRFENTAKKAADSLADVQSHCNEENKRAAKEIKENYDAKIVVVQHAFDEYIGKKIKTSGLLTAIEFVKGILAQIDLCDGQMMDEIKELENDESKFQRSSKSANDALKNKKTLFGLGLTDIFEDINTSTNKLAKAMVDGTRHQHAHTFFQKFKTHVKQIEASLAGMLRIMESDAICPAFNQNVLALMKDSGSKSPFIIDISKELSKNIDCSKDGDIRIDLFVDSLENKDVFSLLGKKASEIKDLLLQYANEMQSVKDFDKVTVNTEIAKLSVDERKRLMEDALRKSDILLPIDEKGQPICKGVKNYIYVAAKNGDSCFIAEYPEMKNLIEAAAGDTKISYAPIEDENRVIIYRQRGVYPVFQLKSIHKYESDYRNKLERKSFSIDANLEKWLENERWNFMPNKTSDKDSLDLWVRALIHKLIRHQGSRYEVYSPASTGGDNSNNGWVRLAAAPEREGTEARYYAFEDFKKNKAIYKSKGDLLDAITEKENQYSAPDLRKLYASVAEMAFHDFDRYINEISAVGVLPETLNSAGYAKTKDLINQETNYAKYWAKKSEE